MYILILDLEATCWEHGQAPMEPFSEIIEVGAVLFDPRNESIHDEFQTFVKPVVHPNLSDFCQRLTSISQEQVDRGMSLTEALDRLAVICRTHDAVFASWGHEDRKQILDSCSRFGIDYPFSNQHLNIKTAFAAFRDIPPVSMAEALRLVGLKLVGTHHRALDDARNVACLSAHMIRNGFEFHI